MLLDDGDDLPQLLEEVLTHVLITAADYTQEGRHHLRGGEGRGGVIYFLSPIYIHVFHSNLSVAITDR